MTSTDAARRAVLGRVVEQVVDRAPEPVRRALDDARRDPRLEHDAAARGGARGRPASSDEPVEADLLGRRGGFAVAGELDDVRDELAELLGLGDDVGEQRVALGRREVRRVAQDLGVRPQARHRRAQLVRGVGDQPPLGVERRAERACDAPRRSSIALKRRASRPSSSSPAPSIRRVEVAGRLDVLGGRGEVGDRRHDPAGEHAAHGRGERGPDHAQHEQHQRSRASDAVDAVERAARHDAPRARAAAP